MQQFLTIFFSIVAGILISLAGLGALHLYEYEKKFVPIAATILLLFGLVTFAIAVGFCTGAIGLR